MSLDDLIAACFQQHEQRTYKAPSGQHWREVSRDERMITLQPEYPTSRSDTVTMSLQVFQSLGWIEVTE